MNKRYCRKTAQSHNTIAAWPGSINPRLAEQRLKTEQEFCFRFSEPRDSRDNRDTKDELCYLSPEQVLTATTESRVPSTYP